MAWTKEKQREYAKKWIREKRASSLEFRKKESNKTRNWQKRFPLENALSQYRTSAKRRGLEFIISNEDFSNLVYGNCTYCGSSASPINGIDRIDSSLGYVIGNVTPCCIICNRAKNALSLGEFNSWVIRVFNHLIKK